MSRKTGISDWSLCRSYQSPCIFLLKIFKKILKLKKKNMIYSWLLRSFVAVCRLSLALVSRGCSLVEVCGTLMKAALLVAEHGLEGAWASVIAACGLRSCGSRALEYRLNRWGAWTWLLCSLWDLPRSGILGTDVSCTGR